MLKRDKMIEVLVTASTLVALGVIVFVSSAYGARGLSEIYGDADQFRAVTLLAMGAFRWTPFLFGSLLLGYIWLSFRPGECRWASWSALSIAALTTGMVFYGIVLPFASTTFRMGNS